MKRYPDDPGPRPRYQWKETWPGEGHEDYSGWDGDRKFGRIMLEIGGATDGRWRWSICQIDGVKQHIMPHNGWLPYPRVAAAQVEDLYERTAELNGLALKTRR